ncbi:MAG: hypothetical protein GEU79_17515 [Acidimicrobiia bacterium]|nr:hypothetical protein [Acidimicrobiia bacterium]
MTIALQLAAFGVVQGAFLLLASLGFSLTRRVEGFLNIAHAQYLAISAFVTLYLNNIVGLHFAIASIAAVVVTCAVALLVARTVFDPIRRFGPAIALITSVGVVYMLEGVIHAVVGTGTSLLTLPNVPAISLGPVNVTFYQAMVVLLAVVATVATALVLNHTRMGTAIRITALDRELGASRGVDVDRASIASWLLSSFLAALGGIALSLLGSLTADKGFDQILIILAVALLAGIGSIWSLAASAFLIGIARELSLLWLPGGYRDIIAFGFVIVVLVFLPRGISGQSE